VGQRRRRAAERVRHQRPAARVRARHQRRARALVLDAGRSSTTPGRPAELRPIPTAILSGPEAARLGAGRGGATRSTGRGSRRSATSRTTTGGSDRHSLRPGMRRRSMSLQLAGTRRVLPIIMAKQIESASRSSPSRRCCSWRSSRSATRSRTSSCRSSCRRRTSSSAPSRRSAPTRARRTSVAARGRRSLPPGDRARDRRGARVRRPARDTYAADYTQRCGDDPVVQEVGRAVAEAVRRAAPHAK